jgi:SAM-dependent methyltransferase
MPAEISRESTPFPSALLPSTQSLRALRFSGEPYDSTGFAEKPKWRAGLAAFIDGFKRRCKRERRRRKVGRAYDMALEIARLVPRGADLLDVGCGNGFIAHHLSAMLASSVVGIDVTETAEAPIDFRRFDGEQFPLADNSVDAVILCYVLHHAQDVQALLSEVRRVLRDDGRVVVYEDIPRTLWDRGVCAIHNRQWRDRTGPCTFRNEVEWRKAFMAFGFEIRTERQLSRWRNFTHPVGRRTYLLKVKERLQRTDSELSV